jgi:hypothetical protein
LFFADSAAGDATTVTGWSLDITAVPEPTTWALGVFGALLMTSVVGKRYWNQRKAASVNDEMRRGNSIV